MVPLQILFPVSVDVNLHPVVALRRYTTQSYWVPFPETIRGRMKIVTPSCLELGGTEFLILVINWNMGSVASVGGNEQCADGVYSLMSLRLNQQYLCLSPCWLHMWRTRTHTIKHWVHPSTHSFPTHVHVAGQGSRIKSYHDSRTATHSIKQWVHLSTHSFLTHVHAAGQGTRMKLDHDS